MKTNLIGRLVALGAVTTLIAGFGTIGYNTETGADLSNKIEELKQLAITWKQNASAKDQLISQKEQELSALQGKYESILSLLGISDMNADENTIKEAINSMSSEQDLKDIATALGIADTASKAEILNEISVMGETMTTLKDSIDTLESTVSQLTAEIERLQGEVNEANTAEQTMLTAVETAIDEIGEPGTSVNETTLTAEQQALKNTMNEAWATVLTKEISADILEAVKDNDFTVQSTTSTYKISVNGSYIGDVDHPQLTALNNYKNARTAYLNSLNQ